jgi:predicted NAD/FAD-binding protein
MKIAVVGTGIAGNVAAYHLCREHEVTVFEANDRIGGHTHTHDVHAWGRDYRIDTGFIVFNKATYPHFLDLLHELGVAYQDSDMSFSVRCDRTAMEYNGTTINSLFAQRSNLLKPAFLRMIRDILRFNREAVAIGATLDEHTTLGDFLMDQQFSREFIDWYIVPMGAAIWSTDPAQMLGFPASYFIRFFANHGLLSVNDRPQWYVVKGGSDGYLRKLSQPYRDSIRLRSPVVSIRRLPHTVEVTTASGGKERFDYVFVATHSDQALAMLRDPSPEESEVLGSIRYQKNDVVLHTDARTLPRRRRAWAAWNYRVPVDSRSNVTVTYNMNQLQSLESPEPFCVTLNDEDSIDPSRVIKRLQYDHPMYEPGSIAAQRRQEEINGPRRTFFCGAYWRYGFHEDGVVSALNALQHFQTQLRHAELHLRRAS